MSTAALPFTRGQPYLVVEQPHRKPWNYGLCYDFARRPFRFVGRKKQTRAVTFIRMRYPLTRLSPSQGWGVYVNLRRSPDAIRDANRVALGERKRLDSSNTNETTVLNLALESRADLTHVSVLLVNAEAAPIPLGHGTYFFELRFRRFRSSRVRRNGRNAASPNLLPCSPSHRHIPRWLWKPSLLCGPAFLRRRDF